VVLLLRVTCTVCFLLQLTWLLLGVTPIVLAQVFGHQLTSSSLPSSTVGIPTAAHSSPQPSMSPSPYDVNTSGHGVLPHQLLYVLLLGLVASRFGLWLFDLAVTQLQQELVPQTELGELSTTPLLLSLSLSLSLSHGSGQSHAHPMKEPTVPQVVFTRCRSTVLLVVGHAGEARPGPDTNIEQSSAKCVTACKASSPAQP
jgi:hypothetical protein